MAALDRQRKAAQGPSTALKNGHANRLAGQRVIYLEGVALNLGQPLPRVVDGLHGHPLIRGKAFSSHLAQASIGIREKTRTLKGTTPKGRRKGLGKSPRAK